MESTPALLLIIQSPEKPDRIRVKVSSIKRNILIIYLLIQDSDGSAETNFPARRTQAHTLSLVSQFYTFSEHQPKDIEDKVCMYHS